MTPSPPPPADGATPAAAVRHETDLLSSSLAAGEVRAVGESAGLSRRAAGGAAWVALGAFASNATASTVMLVLAAVLRPEDLGVLALGQLVFVICNTLHDLGLWDVLVFVDDEDEDEAAEAVLLCWLIGSALLAMVVVATSPLLADAFGAPRAQPVIAVSGSLIVCYAAAGVPMALRTRRLDLKHRALVQMSAVLVGGTTTVVLVLGTDLGIAAMVLGQVTSAVALVLIAWTVGPRVRPRWHPRVVRSMVGYGRHSFGTGLFSIAQYNVDYVLVAHALGAAGLGVYSLAFRISFLPYALVTTVLSSTMFALLCRVQAAERAGVVVRYLRTVLLLVTPLATGLVVFAPAITVLGPEWEPAVGPVRVLGAYVLVTSTVSVAESALKGIGLPHLSLISAGTHLLLLVVLLLALAERGVLAVSVVRAGLAVVVALLAWTMLSRHLHPSGRGLARALVIPVVGAAAMALASVAAGWSPTSSDVDLVTAVPQAVLGLLAYAAVVAVADRESSATAARATRRAVARARVRAGGG